MTDASERRGPLAGIKVLDLTRVLAGPYATLLLWELGAEIIKVEAPGHGDDTRAFPPTKGGESVYFASINRGKRSIALNLKDVGDRAVFEALLARADVLVENFQPGTMARLGYDYASVHALHPRLVYGSISGFGQTGPLANRPAYDLIVQAMGGMMSINGPEGGDPTRVGASIGDLGAGVFGALGIVAALFDRQISGKGRHVDIAMLDVQVALLEAALVRYFATGVISRPSGSRHPVITPFDTFRTKDGIVAIAVANEGLFQRLARALGRGDLATDPRFATLGARATHHAALKAEIEAVLAKDGAAAWIVRLAEAGIPCGPVNDMAGVAAEPQLAARTMFVTAEDPDIGEIRMIGNPVKISGFDDPPTRPPAPNLDEARAEILAMLGLAPQDQRGRERDGEKPAVW
jgi:CoA:oxalate CoA-transferase